MTPSQSASSTKQCTLCGMVKPLTAFYVNRAAKDGLTARCEDCGKAKSNAYYHSQKGRAAVKLYHQSETYKNRLALYRQTEKWKGFQKRYWASEKGKATQERYASTEKGKVKKRAQARKYWLSEKGKAYQRRFNKTPAGKARYRRYRQSAKGKAFKKKTDRSYRNTPGGQAAKKRSDLRRVRMLKGAMSNLTAQEWATIQAQHKGRCFYCHKKRPLTMDHIIPLVAGGNHTKENIVPACRSCNSKKGAKRLLLL